MKEKMLKLDLLGNARSSLCHALSHLTSDAPLTINDYKYAILDIVHSVELLFKEKLRSVDPDLMWKHRNGQSFTVTLHEAQGKLVKFAGVNFAHNHIENIKSIKKLRNKIEHYEFEIGETLAKTHIGRMMSFIFWFSQEYLKLDWEEEFKQDDSWYSLISMCQFFETHVEVVEDRMFREKRCVTECPECGGHTFDFNDEKCEMCGEENAVEVCENCGTPEFEYKIVEVNEQVTENDYVAKRLCECCAAPPYDND